LIRQLEDLDYADNTLRHYCTTLNKLKSFMEEQTILDYSVDVGQCFIEKQVLIASAYRVKQMQTVLSRLNDILDNKSFIGAHTTPKKLSPDLFSGPMMAYLDARTAEGRSPQTVHTDHLYIGRLLLALENNGVDDLSKADAHSIRVAFTAVPVDSSVACTIRKFLRFAYTEGYADLDYSPTIPRIRQPRRVPSVYSDVEVKCLLNSINRLEPVGKRDYAMLLIAALLGLRASDIVSLKPENIDCQRNVITLTQSKTNTPIELPLLDEVKEAVAEYITAARPVSEHPEIFLGSKAPYRPLCASALGSVVSKYFKKAGIPIKGKHHGPHSLRASLATRLLSEDVPYGVIQKVLGHRSALTAKAYLNIDIERLRACALDVPSPSGLFAERLAWGGVL